MLFLLAPFTGALLALTLLALTSVRLLVLSALPAFVAWVIATLLLTGIGRLIVGVASLLLVCHSKFSCEYSRVSHPSPAPLICIEKRERYKGLPARLTRTRCQLVRYLDKFLTVGMPDNTLTHDAYAACDGSEWIATD